MKDNYPDDKKRNSIIGSDGTTTKVIDTSVEGKPAESNTIRSK